MEWSGQKEFVAAATVPFHVDNKEAGLMKNYGSLTFLKVNRTKIEKLNISLSIFVPNLIEIGKTFYRSMMLDTWFRWISQRQHCKCFRTGCKESSVHPLVGPLISKSKFRTG